MNITRYVGIAAILPYLMRAMRAPLSWDWAWLMTVTLFCMWMMQLSLFVISVMRGSAMRKAAA